MYENHFLFVIKFGVLSEAVPKIQCANNKFQQRHNFVVNSGGGRILFWNQKWVSLEKTLMSFLLPTVFYLPLLPISLFLSTLLYPSFLLSFFCITLLPIPPHPKLRLPYSTLDFCFWHFLESDTWDCAKTFLFIDLPVIFISKRLVHYFF